jgi:hypothetical protein
MREKPGISCGRFLQVSDRETSRVFDARMGMKLPNVILRFDRVCLEIGSSARWRGPRTRGTNPTNCELLALEKKTESYFARAVRACMFGE